MKYYIISLSSNITVKYKGENVSQAVIAYLHKQNKGEAKSDRLYFISQHEVSEERYNTYFQAFREI